MKEHWSICEHDYGACLTYKTLDGAILRSTKQQVALRVEANFVDCPIVVIEKLICIRRRHGENFRQTEQKKTWEREERMAARKQVREKEMEGGGGLQSSA